MGTGFTAPGISQEVEMQLMTLIQIGLGGYIVGRSAEKIAKGIDFLFSALVFLVFAWFYQVPLAATAIFIVPLLFIQVLLATGLGLLLSAFNLFYRDIQYLANLVIMLWMYMTPVVYPVSMVPEKYPHT